MMKFLVLIIGLFCVGSLRAQLEMPKTIFWKIISPDGKTTSYLFGTMHILPKDQFYIPKQVTKALKKSDLVIFEVDEDIDQIKMAQMSQYSSGRMSDLLNDDQRDSLYAYIQSTMNLDSAQYESTLGRFKPFVFSQLQFLPYIMNGKSLDRELLQMAQSAKINTYGLETFEEQTTFFDGMSSAQQIAMIMSVVRDTSDAGQSWKENVNLYLKQDIEALMAKSQSGETMTEFFTEELLANRNARWMEALPELTATQSCFIAVGAAHLIEEYGLIAAFKQLGYDVIPMHINMTK